LSDPHDLASIGGVVTMTGMKEQYILKHMHLSKKDFLSYGFHLLFNSLTKEVPL